MKYETPQLTALPSAIRAVESTHPKASVLTPDSFRENIAAYQDWED
jgi:hypothetical protein